MIATGKVSHTGRAAIGISPVTVDQNLQAQGNLPSAQGVLIYQLVAGGAADKAGLKAGDVIVQINGKAINSSVIWKTHYSPKILAIQSLSKLRVAISNPVNNSHIGRTGRATSK